MVNIPNVSDINRYFVRLDHKLTDRTVSGEASTTSKGIPYSSRRRFRRPTASGRDGGYQTENLNLPRTDNFLRSDHERVPVRLVLPRQCTAGDEYRLRPAHPFPDSVRPSTGRRFAQRRTITGHVSIGDYGGSGARQAIHEVSIIDNFTMVRGRHTIQNRNRLSPTYRVSSPPGLSGLLPDSRRKPVSDASTFTGRLRSGNAPTAQPAHAFADFLLGYPVTTYRSTPSAVNLFYQTRYSAYIQDDWQVSPRSDAQLRRALHGADHLEGT